MRDRPVVSAPTDETARIVCWVRVDGQVYALDEDEAWKLAWELIGMCVDHKVARREARDDDRPSVGAGT